jgi:hypothetical protein
MKAIRFLLSILGAFTFTLLLTDRAAAQGFSVSPWTNDASSGIVSGQTSWAYHFGSTSAPTVNGVSVTGVNGPAVSNGNFDLTGTTHIYTLDDLNNVSGSGSGEVARRFVFGGTSAAIKVKGLTPGNAYAVTLLSVGWDSDPSNRTVTFTSGSDSSRVRQNLFGNDNGIRIEYTFVADAATRTINIGYDPANTFHLYGLALRPALISEFDVYGTNERTQLANDATPSDLIDLSRRSVVEEDFNGMSRSTYAVSLSSPSTIIFEQGNQNNLYLSYGDRNDIKTMEIMAHTVIIRSPLKLRQTQLTIHARELRFEGSGQIITTPVEVTQRATDAEASATGKGVDGANGLPGGNVTLHVESLNLQSSGVKFDLTGGRGQNAGKGKHGVRGTSIPSNAQLVSSPVTYRLGVDANFDGDLDDVIGEIPEACDTAIYTAPAGYQITQETLDGIPFASG